MPYVIVVARVRAAKQTKTNVEFFFGPRGPGANENDELFMPHRAKIHPVSGWVCVLLAGYKSIACIMHGESYDLRIT